MIKKRLIKHIARPGDKIVTNPKPEAKKEVSKPKSAKPVKGDTEQVEELKSDETSEVEPNFWKT